MVGPVVEGSGEGETAGVFMRMSLDGAGGSPEWGVIRRVGHDGGQRIPEPWMVCRGYAGGGVWPEVSVFATSKALIGMVHVGALPGSPRGGRSPRELARAAGEEARVLAGAGFDGVIVENMHDAPYVQGEHGPEVVSAMTLAAEAVRSVAPGLVLGVQVLSGGAREALAIAHAVGGAFVRVENFVFAHVADEGLLERAEAGRLLRYRRSIGAEGIRVICDVKKKHASHAITGDLSIGDVVEGAEFFGADGVIVTGSATGKPAAEADIIEARRSTKLPVWVGSGVTPDQLARLWTHADALIIGSWIKKDGLWRNAVDEARCREIVRAAGAVR